MKQKTALCNLEELEDSLVKSIFIQGMSNPQIQMDLLSEDRDPLETLQYAIARERGQENQQRISNTHALNPSGSGITSYKNKDNKHNEEAYCQLHLTTTKYQTAGNADTNS